MDDSAIAHTIGEAMREHPSDGTLEALLDGELPRARAVLVRAHLVRCDACRATVEATRKTASMVNALLRRSAPQVNSASTLERFVVQNDRRAESRARGPAHWASAAALALATAALILAISEQYDCHVPRSLSGLTTPRIFSHAP